MSERADEPTGIITAPDTWPVTRVTGTNMVLVPVDQRGASVKMTEADARAKGLLPEEKAQPPAPNKARRGARNKSVARSDTT